MRIAFVVAIWRALVSLTVKATSRTNTDRDVQVLATAEHVSVEAISADGSRRLPLVRREDGQYDDAGDIAALADPFSDSAPPPSWHPDINARLTNLSTYCCFESAGQKEVVGYDAMEVRQDFCGARLKVNGSLQGNCQISNTTGTFLAANIYQYKIIADCEAICAASSECYGFVADFSVLPRRCAFKKTVTLRAQSQERATDLYTRVWPNTFAYGQVDGWDELTLVDAKSNCCQGEETGTVPGTWANGSYFLFVNLEDCQLRCNTAENCKGFVAYHGEYPPRCGFKGGTNYTQGHADRDWYPRLEAK